MLDMNRKIAEEFQLKEFQVASVINLIHEQDCTVPFIARYRKEMTGSLDEVAIREIRDRHGYLLELETNKQKYLKVVEQFCKEVPAYNGKFPELSAKFSACQTKQELEDLYLPFKPKRRTRAQIAKEKGLGKLFDLIQEKRSDLQDIEAFAQPFVNGEQADIEPAKKVHSVEEALQGARDIFAEQINETAELRAIARKLSQETGVLVSNATAEALDEVKGINSKDKKSNFKKFENYFEYKEPIASAPSHRIMAVRRGEAEKALRVSIEVDETRILRQIYEQLIAELTDSETYKSWVLDTVGEAYKRLMSPSIETELRLELKKRAEDEAIEVFSSNLKNLLLLPPIPGNVVLGVDPGLRTGSKLAVVSETGQLLDSATIYPDLRKPDHPKTKTAEEQTLALFKKYKITCVALGNGTGSREIDRLIMNVIRKHELKIKRLVVNEAGASVYSTDDIAREEFPDLDPTIRSAVSIARRLQDPLAELVKIDPRSIGVGQYQHDVNVTKLKKTLQEAVESCVNKVGVNLNSASYKLLSYVSGIGPTLAKKIVSFRDEKGKFNSRNQALEVSGFGPKAFEQAAGFLRVPGSQHPLDNSSVHPERYQIVEDIINDLKLDLTQIIGNKDAIEQICWDKYVTEQVGMPTLKDIAQELEKPGRDPREDGTRLLYSDDVNELEDLNPGMKLKGTVTNVTNFGAFVDVGVHQDGLVHISELSDQFVKDPKTVVSVGDVVDVRVLEVDLQKRRLSLSRKSEGASAAPDRQGSNERPQRGHGQNRPEGDPNNTRHRQGGRGHPRIDGERNRQKGPSRGKPRNNRGHQKPETNYTLDDLVSKFKR